MVPYLAKCLHCPLKPALYIYIYIHIYMYLGVCDRGVVCRQPICINDCNATEVMSWILHYLRMFGSLSKLHNKGIRLIGDVPLVTEVATA